MRILPAAVLPLILFFLLAMSGSASAQPLLLVTEEYPPYVTGFSEHPGLLYEVVVAAFSEVGVEVRVEFRPWRRCALMVEQGSAFGTFPYTASPERKRYSLFSDAIAECRNVFFYLKGRRGDLRYDKLEDLRHFHVAGTSGHFYESIFAEKGLRVDYAPGEASGIRKVWTMRSDLFAENELVGWNLICRIFPKNKKMFGSSEPWNVNMVRLMVSKRYPGSGKLLKRFNQGLAAIRENGVYDRIVSEYSKR